MNKQNQVEQYWKNRCEVAEELLAFQDNPTYDPQYPSQSKALWQHFVDKESEITSITTQNSHI